MSNLSELAVKMMDAIDADHAIDTEDSRQRVDEAIKAFARRFKMLKAAKRKRARTEDLGRD